MLISTCLFKYKLVHFQIIVTFNHFKLLIVKHLNQLQSLRNGKLRLHKNRKCTKPAKQRPLSFGKENSCGIIGNSCRLALNKFYLGYTKEGIIQLVLNVVTLGAASVIPFIEGILYLFMSDKQFDDTYVYGKKGWL
ncbi:TM2 domain-containing protein [Chryseobacterium sp. R2ACT005]|uniref:TM2 domain-containing protein n=1 Tax=Chryseobacterium sp. R2ACT005 TaxID=3416668 RepID=UPI003CEDFC57